jgi:hypothetical protein
MNRLEIKEVDYLRFKITQAEVQPTNGCEYPQVRKTGVDAVHESCPQMVHIMIKEL